VADLGSQTKSRVVLIGLDGATFEVMDPLIAEGKLPHIASLIERGARSTLLSTIPITSWSAWPALMTGKYPGKHGVYHHHHREGYRERVISSGDVHAETLWETFGRHGRRVAVIGVPVTYPPRQVNGAMVSGPPMPPGVHAHPAALADELSLAVDGYPSACLGVDWGSILRLRGAGALVRHLERCFDLSLRAALHLWRRAAWDFFACAFCELDRAQHLVPWPHDLSRPGAAARRGLVKRCYQKADQVVGELVAAAGKDSTIALVSAHGFGENRKTFYLNRWLAEQGWLALESRPRRRWRMVRCALDEALGSVGLEIGGLFGELPVWVPRCDARCPLELLDWRRTRAFAAAADLDGMCVNLRGREPQGIVEPGAEYEDVRDALIAALKQVRDPDTGEPIVAWARRREDVFHGPHLDRAPDVVYMTRDNSYPQSGQLDLAPGLGPTGAGRAGGHRAQGVLILAGPAIKRGAALAECRAVDVAPTLLRAVGFPLAEDLDGEVLMAALDHDYLEHGLAGRGERLPAEASAGYSPEEERAMEQQLRSLGFT